MSQRPDETTTLIAPAPLGRSDGTGWREGLARRAGRLALPLRSPLYANAYALIANQMSSAALGFLYWLLAARLYPVDVVGRSSAVISTLLLIAGLAQLGLNAGMVRFVPRAGRHARRLIVGAYLAVPTAAAILSVTFLQLAHVLGLEHKLTGEGLSPVLLVPATVLWAVFYFQDGILNGLRRSVWVLVENLIYNTSKIVLLVAGLYVLGDAGILASWFLPTPLAIGLVVWLVFARFLPAHQATAEDLPMLSTREVVGSVTGDHFGSMISEMSIRALPLLVVALLGAEANAYFYQAWLVATTFSMAAIGMCSSYTAQAAADPENVGKHSRDILRHMLLLIGPPALIIAAFAPSVLAVFGSRYVAAAPLLRVLALAAPIVAFNIWYLSYVRVMGRIGRVIALQGVTAAILLAVSYAALPVLGILGIGLAWLLGQAAVAVFGAAEALPLLRAKPSPAAAASAPTAVASRRRPARVTPSGAVTAARAGHALFVSPHLDDAVLSCGGAIRRLSSQGWAVTVLTVCTADPAPDTSRSSFAQRVETGWALGEAPFALRREEDQEALRLLGAAPRYLGMLDVVYRTAADGRAAYPRPVNVPVDRGDARSFIDAMLPGLTAALEGVDGPVFCPAGVGGHVDHLLVKEAVESVCDAGRILYYEEYPYLSPSRLAAPAAPEGRDVTLSVLALTPDEVDARVSAVACYRSQLRGLFPSPAERLREILTHRLPLIGPRLAVPDTRPPLDRAGARIRPDVSACGGERYWSPAPESWPFA